MYTQVFSLRDTLGGRGWLSSFNTRRAIVIAV